MNFKDYLLGLDWYDFSTYPTQGEAIYLHCIASISNEHKFLKINNFNAVTFEPRVIMKDFDLALNWTFLWLPIILINEFQ